ncbi:MAG: hypothetical protein KIT50_05505 [Bacteroidetes bacterium]|nr:hypothetical protein [Bacteroidota bacterium]
MLAHRVMNDHYSHTTTPPLTHWPAHWFMVAGTAYRGSWAQIGFPGVMAEGPFSAFKK